ncbi:putative Diguanylate cyclase [Candidatus Terasakiella magnetica]|uniref:diguanylate cyclase n=1 Tax=Candidatus Terasakiella magnetica TaxID=1867952 RepID=A0A1C3RE18_9PROT|nr:diguanylate cyclase [Candidatus Terasakiella magnetica]SCA55533.1 putative Diguanylate cyclase [Candidatus Terasakiella magnetica]
MQQSRTTFFFLVLSIASIMLCMVASIYIGYQHLTQTQEAWTRDAAYREKVNAAFLMRESVRERSFRLTIASTLDDYFDRDVELEAFRNEAGRFLKAREVLQKLNLTTEEARALETLENNIRLARPIIEKAMIEVVEEDWSMETRKKLFNGVIAQIDVLNSLNAFVKVFEKASKREAVKAQKEINKAQNNMILLSAAAVVIALLISWFVLLSENRFKRRVDEDTEKLHDISNTDALTDIPNRRAFDEFLQSSWDQALKSSTDLSLILIDIDYFKLYNDKYGHAKGDETLITVAQTLSKEVNRTSDLVARYGGEEFACILPNTNREGAYAVAEHLKETIEYLKIEHGPSMVSDYITISIGLGSITPCENHNLSTFFKTVDDKLYKAKRSGRNRIN